MGAFWALFFLFAWGCLRADGMVRYMRGWLKDNDPWVDPFPLLGKLDLSMAVTLGIVAVIGLILYSLLNRPKVAGMLIDTESELRKVTWPSFADTWKGTLAVIVTVCFMLLYLTGADLMIRFVMTSLLSKGSGAG